MPFPPVSAASFPAVFPFDRTVVTINSVSLPIISTSSAIIDGCVTSISISSAINSVNDSIFSATQTIIHAPSTIIVGSQIIVFEAQIIISVTETAISGGHQNPANQPVPDGSGEIFICGSETIIGGAQPIIFLFHIKNFQKKEIIF